MSTPTAPQSKDINHKSKQLAERISECIHVADHDPSMALYRLQEHIHKTAPVLTRRKYQNLQLAAQLQNACHDLDIATQTLDQMKAAMPTFDRVQILLRNCTYYKQQLDYEERRNNPVDDHRIERGT